MKTRACLGKGTLYIFVTLSKTIFERYWKMVKKLETNDFSVVDNAVYPFKDKCYYFSHKELILSPAVIIWMSLKVFPLKSSWN